MKQPDIQPYHLPDSQLLRCGDIPAGMVWQPDDLYIVLGRSNQPEKSLRPENIAADAAPVIRRPSGGEAVILSPRTLVVAQVWPLSTSSQKEVFTLCNRLIIESLVAMGVEGLNQKGISDISVGMRKIAGSAMHKARDRWFYHAVLNIAEPAGTIAWYLAHPPREPDYRQGRPHSEFVTNLAECGYPSDPMMYAGVLEKSLRNAGLRILY